MQSLVRIFFTLTLILNFAISNAQSTNREVVNQATEWFAIASDIKISKHFKVITEAHFRYARAFEPMQYQARTGFEIKLNDHFSIVPVGYAYTWNYIYGKQPADFKDNEHRLWEQVSYKHAIKRIELEHRLRLEQRFIQAHELQEGGTVTGDEYSENQHRIRYRFTARVPLNNTSVESHTYFLSLYDEVFVSWGEGVEFHEPDQNRVFAGLGYAFSKAIALQGGFFYQMQINDNGKKQENNLGVNIQFTYDLDFSKEAK